MRLKAVNMDMGDQMSQMVTSTPKKRPALRLRTNPGGRQGADAKPAARLRLRQGKA